MPRAFTSVSEFLSHGFDDLIDVRSPAEFADDHVPGAISLPVLSNDERARVGTIYVQQSPFLARKIGGALVYRNAAAHVEGPLADRDGAWRPLVYCWRGGMRSGAFASFLGQIGWRSDTVEGGYRTWRRLVQRSLYEEALPFRLVLLDGLTGTGKTELLQLLEGRGLQVLDLERLAHHRGSLLGALPGGQPGQKAFETALAARLAEFDPARPVLVEAESSKIGNLSLPPSLWSVMQAATRIEVHAGPEPRSRYLAHAYGDLLGDRERIEPLLRLLIPVRGREVVENWLALQHAGQLKELSAALMSDHYDPAYLRSRARHPVPYLLQVDAGMLTDADLNRAADRIAKAARAL